ncbi:MAG: hypothetical protein HWN66_03165 [Candidatus Helarchaeota archaeon]|nr:hypothetical protein [Candidatus Helarchaeota archaeon]
MQTTIVGMLFFIGAALTFLCIFELATKMEKGRSYAIISVSLGIMSIILTISLFFLLPYDPSFSNPGYAIGVGAFHIVFAIFFAFAAIYASARSLQLNQSILGYIGLTVGIVIIVLYLICWAYIAALVTG